MESMSTTPETAPVMHAWQIEAREYARQESRRGRRHAFEHLVPGRTALIVVDMVPFFLEESDHARGIVTNISLLADSLRAAGGTVAWVLPGAGEPSAVSDEFLGPDIAKLFRASGGVGPLQGRVWREFEVHPDDLLVEKTAASAFFPGRSPLPTLLAERKVDTVLITGTVANVCCESSARDASTLGYRVIMVADANAARRDQDLNATLYTVYRTFGDVRPTSEVLELIVQGSRETSLAAGAYRGPYTGEPSAEDLTQAQQLARAEDVARRDTAHRAAPDDDADPLRASRLSPSERRVRREEGLTD
jgi:nicotinamidase-related amidase